MTPATLRATEASVTRPCLRRSSGTNAMPALDRGARVVRRRPPRRPGATVPGVVAVDAEDGAGDLAAAGADEAGQADDLAGADLEGDVVEDARRGRGPRPRGRRRRPSAGVFGNRSPTSRPTIRRDDLVDGGVGDRRRWRRRRRRASR